MCAHPTQRVKGVNNALTHTGDIILGLDVSHVTVIRLVLLTTIVTPCLDSVHVNRTTTGHTVIAVCLASTTFQTVDYAFALWRGQNPAAVTLRGLVGVPNLRVSVCVSRIPRVEHAPSVRTIPSPWMLATLMGVQTVSALVEVTPVDRLIMSGTRLQYLI